LTALVASVVGTGIGAAQTAPPVVTDDVRGFAIDPPGQCGHIDNTSSECAHYEDQIPMYKALVNDDDVTEEELPTYFKSMQFGPGTNIASEYSPVEGVTVYRDEEFGVPHIYASSLNTASFALGYVSAEDRLWEMDVFRHAARGTLTEFIGNDGENGYLNMDIATRREGYVEAEVQKMYDDLDDKFANGKLVQDGLQAYTDGINAYMDEARLDPTKMPFEYSATQNPSPEHPVEWTNTDTLFLVVLQLRVFGETAGDELQNAGLYAHLKDSLGNKLGPKVFNDFAFQNDPSATTSIAKADGNFKTQSLGKIDWKSVAIPDNATDVAINTARAARTRDDLLRSIGFGTGGPASNALIVSREESKTENPLQIGAPQVGYAAPGFFMEIDVHAPGIDFRGPAVPGASALIPLGRGRDYAWSLTTGYSDAVDTRAEKLCDPEGGEPTLESTGYMHKGKCKEMESRDETFTIKPTLANPGPPGEEVRTFYRTLHGPVFQRALVKGKPTAFVKERFFWKKEVDSVPQFARWNMEVDDIDDFASAAKDFTMSFNAFYADANNIGYWHVGHYPKRVAGQHPSLPTWGTGKWDWKGRRPFSEQPKILNPDTGWIANWNNKPTAGWSNMDSAKWGSIHRVDLLDDKMHSLLDGPGKANLSDLVDVIGESATQDTRGLYLGPKMLKWAAGKEDGGDQYDAALELVQEWVSTGAHRENADEDENMDKGAALAIFDAWYDKLVHRVYDDELGEDGYELLLAPVTDYVPAGGSNFWFDMSSYLKTLFNKKTAKRLALPYCDDRNTEDEREKCAALVIESLEAALQEQATAQGSANVSEWTTPREDIEFQAFGYGAVDPIPWQNRGTHNHATEILRDSGPVRPQPAPTGSGSPSTSP
jgi:acyl-homoserine lactone acylase PvdQ